MARVTAVARSNHDAIRGENLQCWIIDYLKEFDQHMG